MCADESKETSGKRVLVVDDDRDFRDFCKMVLEKDGYQVSVAHSGQEGRDLARSERPDVMLLDMMMETWSEGSNVADELRSSPETKDIPIIMVSAVDMQNPVTDVEDVDGVLQVDYYLVKPVKAEDLLLRVKEALKGS